MKKISKILGFLTLIGLLLIVSCKPSNKINKVVGITKATLENSRWALIELNAQPLTIENKPYLVFAAKSMVVNGFGGCNQLAGSYEVSGQKIKLNNIAATRMFCQETMAIENSFLQSLQVINTYKIESQELLLLQDDTVIARFRIAN
jgi:heat shock protein HslJ